MACTSSWSAGEATEHSNGCVYIPKGNHESRVKILVWNSRELRAGFSMEGVQAKECSRHESRFWRVSKHIKSITLFSVSLISKKFLFDELSVSWSWYRFAAALNDLGVDCWVMNVVPVSGFNTLPVIYDRGLVGAMHDWYINQYLTLFASSRRSHLMVFLRFLSLGVSHLIHTQELTT